MTQQAEDETTEDTATLRSKYLPGLVKVCSRASKITRLKVANGIFMSKLCYLIELWGACEEYVLSALQVLQNRAARVVTNKSWFTCSRILLAQCRWLSVSSLCSTTPYSLPTRLSTMASPSTCTGP